MAMIPNKDSVSSFLRPWGHLSTGGVVAALLSTLAVSLSWFLWHHTYYKNLSHSIIASEKQLTTLKLDGETLANFQTAEKQSLQIYQDFHRKHLNHPTSPDFFKEKIQKWQKQLKIQTLNTQIGAPVLESGSDNLWRIPISIDLSVLKDKIFFQLLEKIQWEIPGLILIKNFTISRVSALTDDMVRELIRGSGKDIKLFQGKIELEWVYTAFQ
jgi:hypothetical protein